MSFTTLASLAFIFGRSKPFTPSLAAASAMESAPFIGLSVPSKASSPTKAYSDIFLMGI